MTVTDKDYESEEKQLQKALEKQLDINESDKNKYNLTKEKVDLKLQLEKSRNLMDMKRIASFYIQEGKVYVSSAIVYSNSLGTIARPVLRKKIEKPFLVDEINEIVYPNGDIEPLLVFDCYNVKSVKIQNTIQATLLKDFKDFQDSFDLLEKRFLGTRLANLYSDKWSIGIVFVLGGVFGWILGKTLKI